MHGGGLVFTLYQLAEIAANDSVSQERALLLTTGIFATFYPFIREIARAANKNYQDSQNQKNKLQTPKVANPNK